ncbi:hypothetical protein [Polaribacter porphyrae]|uniref:Bulb-type lectin domain-containing protein n=1 Tax=Polaribacter porphyrae TaxID=1137780 RepID=A0A2S7WTU2_9FLAO|nr:hypothetical protein [Polaribacter porphyrae]PQJ81018.1 hypothetical protein BTO18_13675 [Polaribacter porphyrae]
MKNSIIYIILVFVASSCSKESVYQNTYNKTLQIETIKTFGGSKNDAFLSVKSTFDGGYIAVGHSQSSDFDIKEKTNDSYDYWVLKFDNSNNLVWNKTFGGSNDDRARDIIELNDGSFIISGFSRSNDVDVTNNEGNYDFWVVKIDENGNLIWEKNFGFSGSDQAFVIKQVSDNSILLGGSLDVTASGGQGNSKVANKHAGGDYWLIKIDINGNKLWSKYYGGLFTDTLLDIAETDNGNYILTGFSDSADTNISNNLGTYDYWVVKVDNSGTLLWEKNFGGSEIDEAYAISKTPEDAFLIVGNSRSLDKDISKNNGSSDIWVIKIDVDGKLLWEKNFGGSSFEGAKKIIPFSNGGFLIVGSSRSADTDVTENKGNKDVWVIKINNEGTLEWQKSIGGSELEEANSIVEFQNGAIIVGESWSSDQEINVNKGFSDALLIKLK